MGVLVLEYEVKPDWYGEDADGDIIHLADYESLFIPLDSYMSKKFSDWDYPIDFTLLIRDVTDPNNKSDWEKIDVTVEPIPNFLFRVPKSMEYE